MTRIWLLIALVAVGCGDDDLDDAPHSGARLKLAWTVGEDGSRVAAGGMRDSMLGIDCYPSRWSDGVWRCAPEGGFVGYADSECKQPVVLNASPGDLAAEFLPATCDIGRAFRAGPVSGASQYYLATLDGCFGPYTGDTISSTDGELDPDEFAGVRVSDLQGDGRLRTIDFVSDDGFRQLKETRDTELGTACNPELGECAPAANYEVDYRDAACTQPVAPVYRDPCGEPVAYVAQPDPSCPSRTIYSMLGPSVAVDQVYTSGSGCTAQAASPQAEYHSIGAPISPATLATALGNVPGRRLQQIYFAGDGIAARTGQLMDTKIGLACSWNVATDGKTRCLPASAYESSYYADGSCTTQITVGLVSTSTGCAPQPVPQFAQRYIDTGYEVKLIAGPHAGSIYMLDNGGCTVFTGNDVYDLGELVDPLSFVAATTMFDP